MKNKQGRIDELKPILDDVLTTGKVVPCELPSFLGKLQYADAQVWGRAGRVALRDLRSHGSFSRVPVSLDPSGVEAIRLLRDRLVSGKPPDHPCRLARETHDCVHRRSSGGGFKSRLPCQSGGRLV